MTPKQRQKQRFVLKGHIVHLRKILKGIEKEQAIYGREKQTIQFMLADAEDLIENFNARSPQYIHQN